mgnify:CR=1 FL=1
MHARCGVFHESCVAAQHLQKENYYDEENHLRRLLAFLFAAAGALTAAALYLYHREKELDEYERLLFSDDYEDDDYDDEDSTTYENIPSAPAEEKE